MMQPEALDVLIVEDEPQLATLHAEFIEQNFALRVVAYAATLAEARAKVNAHQPRLILLDNFLPDGQGIELMEEAAVKNPGCSVIFITAASDMNTCSQAIRNGAFDYIIKPVSYKRLRNSLERFMQFVQTQRTFKVIDQSNVDALYNLQSKQFSSEPSAKGIETNTLELVQALFIEQPEAAHAVEDVVKQVGISKTTARRYLEYCVATQFVRVEMMYGNIGHPRRLYRKA
ncbi:Transcriptional regulatory protein CitB [compost metagenome]|jgi:two-component system response regulator CitB|uniref:Transcriptional regulatory protein n=2 Tax=Serratia quinivorans TaxID=137545 RepID=A0A380A5Z3_9GAMM|nr:two-component system response regulator CitB [Serratia sp. BIGb0163]CAI0944414.1 Transcriptional regulatory protein CitB [Serratia quinivorans]CAI1059735.1 Transcriptional regulatory protein CitB [Serratia quinivorans]CAI1213036.1 Transcriptional regulatory protein CitB [Serratia quinivorans]CAI1588795.1 Transcriptional regulatory protein CitB [Serratia quinivorans]